MSCTLSIEWEGTSVRFSLYSTGIIIFRRNIMTAASRGWRKWSIIFILLLPTLIGITAVNLIPMIYNFRISFTNADRGLHNGLYNKSLGQWNIISDVGWNNYQKLFAELITPDALNAFVKFIVTALPLIVAFVVRSRLRKGKLVPPDTRPVLLGG